MRQTATARLLDSSATLTSNASQALLSWLLFVLQTQTVALEESAGAELASPLPSSKISCSDKLHAKQKMTATMDSTASEASASSLP